MKKADFFNSLVQEHQQTNRCASTKVVAQWLTMLLSLIVHGLSESPMLTRQAVENEYDALHQNLQVILLCSKKVNQELVAKVTALFFEELPLIKERLNKDTEAIFKGDPAARSLTEITRAYPGFYAIAAHRIAH